MRELELMGTLGCHLCEVAEGIVISALEAGTYDVYQVDIAEDDVLLGKYATRIPVLVDVTSGKELEWPFNTQQLQQFLSDLTVEV